MGSQLQTDYGVYNEPTVADALLRSREDGLRDADLILSGIRCGGCIARIERELSGVDGVQLVDANFATQRARVTFDLQSISLGGLLAKVDALGYGAQPYNASAQEATLGAEHRSRVRRLLISGLLGMQVMMMAIALHAGTFSGMSTEMRVLLTWVSFFMCLPLLVYGGAPFFQGAWNDLTHRRVGMDVPVALGLTVAFVGSVHATVTGRGDVYYDSVAMFIALLLLARYLEFRARAANLRLLEGAATTAPAVARRVVAGGDDIESVPAASLAAGDIVRVAPGETIPADGCITSGTTTVSESLLTGESAPRPRAPGDRVLAGSTNFDGVLELEVTHTGSATVLSHVLGLAARAKDARPAVARLADRIAGQFVIAILLLASCVAAWYGWHEPQRWLPVTVAVLVVTCPCALSLATPLALTAGLGALARSGMIATSADTLERISGATHAVFDKTGTLTEGRPALVEIVLKGDQEETSSDAAALAVASALEAHSNHPLATAILDAQRHATLSSDPKALQPIALQPIARPFVATDVTHTAGIGVEGTVNGRRYSFGRTRAGSAQHAAGAEQTDNTTATTTTAELRQGDRLVATFHFIDLLRTEAAAAVGAVRDAGLGVSLCSGDNERTVAAVAETLGIDDAHGAMLPSAKLEYVNALGARNQRVLAVGDGVNDTPLLAAASASMAMGRGSDSAKVSADMLLLNDRVDSVPRAIAGARHTRAIVRQNLAWALAYNALAVPAAVAGLVPPWLAAIGMSLSSIVVVLNSTRAGWLPPPVQGTSER